MRKVDNPECKVISLIVDADTERCGCIACLDDRCKLYKFEMIFVICFDRCLVDYGRLEAISVQRTVSWLSAVA